MPHKHSIDPNLGAGRNGAKKQFARMVARVLFQGLPIDEFGPLNGWSEQMRGFVLIPSCRVQRKRRRLRAAAGRGGGRCRTGGFSGGLSAGATGREAQKKRQSERKKGKWSWGGGG